MPDNWHQGAWFARDAFLRRHILIVEQTLVKQHEKQKKTRRLRGFSLIELLIVISIILIILAIALPKLNKTQMYAKEMAAQTTIQRAIQTAEAQYMSQYGRYAQSLTELGPPASGAPTMAAADLIPGDLAKGDKGGYKYTITGTPQGYQINAEPTAFGSTGSRTFYSDQSLVIHAHSGQEPATANDGEIK